MSEILKLKYKVGEIEFEAEGSAEEVEQQRINFMNAVLPAAVSAMVQTHNAAEQRAYIESTPETPLLECENKDEQKQLCEPVKADYSRTNLAAFIKKYGQLNDQDFVLFAAYFDEKKNGVKYFSSESVKQYYLECRRSAYSNNSALLGQLVKKGYIMDAPDLEETGRKQYMLTDDGIHYIETFTPKATSNDSKPKAKPKRNTSKIVSQYSAINADDLNLIKYPAVKSLSGAKEQVIMSMYIVTNEGKGEWFTVDDIIYLLINVFEVPANSDMVNGVFKRNKSMFASEKDTNNLKALRKKLLSGAKDFAVEIIGENQAK